MQLTLPLLPSLNGKKEERITIAVSKAHKEFLAQVIKAYESRGTVLTESEFVYLSFIEGLQKAIGALSFPDYHIKKIF